MPKDKKIINYKMKKGRWEDFFNFELPDLIYSGKVSNPLVYSVHYPPDEKLNLPASILEISIYNIKTYYNQKVLKAKLWFDKDEKFSNLKPEHYFKYSEYLFELEEILYKIGEELKITILIDKTTIIKIKEPSNYPFDIIFLYFKNKIKENLPNIENSISKLMKKEKVDINEYITLELERNFYHVYCKGKKIWTFTQDDIKRPKPIEIEKSYEEWFKNEYLPLADNSFEHKKLEFSDVYKLFQKWNDNNLKNLDFNWYFYKHLMQSLYDAGHPDAMKIYDSEIKKRDEIDLQLSLKKFKEKITQVEMWNDFFDFKIPEQELKALEYSTISWMIFPHDAEKMIPRSILDFTIYKVKNPTDKWLEVKWYLERQNEIREIEHERNTYYKYSEFLSKKIEILKNLGEDIKLTAFLNGLLFISFNTPNFIPSEIIFPNFKEKMNQMLKNLKSVIFKEQNN
ncbi:MAG: hypothetical protein ACTSRH_14355 [Promethearchaeota archaeon]